MGKLKLYISIIISFILGVAIGGFGVKYIYDAGYGDYDLNMLNDMERMSYDFHRAFDPEASGEAQAVYILYSYRAWKAGMIPEPDYHLHQALGHLRFCISLEKRGKDETANKSCMLAEKELKLWNQNMSFEDFRDIVESKYFTIEKLSNQSFNLDGAKSAPPS